MFWSRLKTVFFFIFRCTDLMSGVTKVLQSVGVNCCTIQPEFASCSGASPSDASLPRRLACSLACTKACEGSMCCSPVEEESKILLAPPAGETTLVLENTFLKKNKWMIRCTHAPIVKMMDVICLKTWPSHYDINMLLYQRFYAIWNVLIPCKCQNSTSR